MPWYLGIDTSNYTTSAAVYNPDTGELPQRRELLPVKPGEVGLRQADAVFLHVRQLGPLLSELLEPLDEPVRAAAASASPRDEEGSYMPCFLVGRLAAQAAAATAGAPLHSFSHQAGHVAAALYSADKLALRHAPFLAFHFSGGTTQCLLVRPDTENIFTIETVAETLDLNAGQAVDRVGKLLGLSFPAGPGLEALALQSAAAFNPKPAFRGKDCCLSGLENLCARMLERQCPPADVARFCLDYLAAAVLEMTRRVLAEHPGLPLVYAGGVLANSLIRGAVEARYNACFARPAFSSDNAAGTAVLCALRERGNSL